MNKKILAAALVPLLLLTACGNNQTQTTKTVAVSDFVYYDFTRELTKDTDISVELVKDAESGRDKNKLKNADMVIGYNDYSAADNFFMELNRIYIPSVVDAVELRAEDNRINDSSYKLFGSSTPVVPNQKEETPVNPTESVEQQGTQTEETAKPDSATSEAETGTDNTTNNGSNNTNSNTNNEATTEEANEEVAPYVQLLMNESSDYDGAAPSGSNSSGYNINDMPIGYSLDSKDAYDTWLLNRIYAITNSQRKLIVFAALSDSNGGYVVFQSKHNGLSYTVLERNSYSSIPILPFFNTNYLFIESRAAGCFQTKTAMAKTAAFDENYWMDVSKAKDLVTAIKEGLIKTYPENVEIIEKNYKEYSRKLELLDGKYQTAVDDSKNGLLLICGAFTYGHMVDAYGIDYISLYDYNYQDAMPSITRLTTFADIINNNNIKYVVKDKESNTEAINSLKESLDENVNILVIDTMTNADIDDSYLEIMEENLVILKKALY